ncbi:MAG: serine/threonine protein kinase [Pyrinomonadaceae bacterium]
MLTSNQLLQKGRYRILNTLSSDQAKGFYSAYDTVSETTVVVRESTGTGADALDSSCVGVENLRGIRHDSLLGLSDYFQETERGYMVFGPFDGKDLAEHISARGSRPSVDEVIAWTGQILGALDYLHRLPTPIIHGNIRPQTICVAGDGTVKLLAAPSDPRDPADEGVAYRPLEQVWSSLDPTSQKVVAKSLGDDYEPQLRKPLDARSDIYSLAAVAYELLCGETPRAALERAIEMLDDNPDPLTPLAEAAPEVPAEFAGLVMRALSMRREERFASAEEFRSLLPSNGLRAAARPPADDNAVLDLEPAAVPATNVGFEWSEEELYTDTADKSEASSPHSTADDGDFAFSTPEPAKKSWLVPAIAAAVLVLAAVGGWFALSGGSSPAPAATASQQVQAQPSTQPAAESPAAELPASQDVSATSANPAQTGEQTAAEKRNAAAPAAKDKDKKATAPAAKPSEEKKKVTVDDLINDN